MLTQIRGALLSAVLALLVPAAGAAEATPAPSASAVAEAAPAGIAAIGADLALQALSFVGVPYRFGGEDPARGFDCSGLVRHVARVVLGLDLPRTSEAIARVGQSVARDALQGGDLVFFNTLGHRNSHVGVYIGDGRFVHAPTRNGVVRVEALDDRYWRTRFNGARRVHAGAATASATVDRGAPAAPASESPAGADEPIGSNPSGGA